MNWKPDGSPKQLSTFGWPLFVGSPNAGPVDEGEKVLEPLRSFGPPLVGARASALVRRAKAAKRTADLVPIIEAARAAGATSLRSIAAYLNEQGIPAHRGGGWSAVQIKRTLDQAELKITLRKIEGNREP